MGFLVTLFSMMVDFAQISHALDMARIQDEMESQGDASVDSDE